MNQIKFSYDDGELQVKISKPIGEATSIWELNAIYLAFIKAIGFDYITEVNAVTEEGNVHGCEEW